MHINMSKLLLFTWYFSSSEFLENNSYLIVTLLLFKTNKMDGHSVLGFKLITS